MNAGITSFKKNTALIAIVIIDLMFLVWSCENESGKIVRQLEKRHQKEVVQISQVGPSAIQF